MQANVMIIKLNAIYYLVVPTSNSPAKGQLISKWLFGVFNFLQKTNENKLT